MTRKTAIHYLILSFPLGGLLVSPALAADLHAPPANTAPTVTIAPSPFDLNVTYVGEVWHNEGGIKTGTDYMYNLDMSLGINAQQLLGLQDAKFYIEGFYAGGKSLESYTGALQGASAVDAYGSMNTLKLYQLYYEQKFGATDVLAGKFDAQQQFATTRPMDLFGNKGFATNFAFLAAGLPNNSSGFSTYPDTAIGVRIKQTISDQWSVKLGLLDGEADLPNGKTGVLINSAYGALGVGEVDYTPWANTKLMAGVWGDTGKIKKLGQFTSSFTPIQTWGEVGEYVGGATRLYTIEGARSVDGFFNVGFAPGTTALINHSYNAGLTFTGLLAARPSDKLGVAVGITENSPGYRALDLFAGTHLAKYETAYELTYRARITDWLAVQPEVDYIEHPSYGGTKNAVVFGLHFELHKEFF